MVSRSYGSAFKCSALSCNHAADRVKVVDDLAKALRLAARFSCEPGPFHVVEAWRQEAAAALRVQTVG